MTNAERIASLEARIAALEARLAVQEAKAAAPYIAPSPQPYWWQLPTTLPYTVTCTTTTQDSDVQALVSDALRQEARHARNSGRD